MKIRIFSVVGEALNFGARRMETIARVAGVPVVLLFVLNMGAAFTALSIANGKILTFKDAIAARVSYDSVFAQALQQASILLQQMSIPMWILAITIAAINVILISSFMAPLIRYAGLGEKPAPGVLQVPFGADQLRYIVASLGSFIFLALLVYSPIGLASYLVMQHINTALAVTYASFPNSESLHTIELVNAAEKLTADGSFWLFDFGYWIATAAITGGILWFVLMLHFQPRGHVRDRRWSNAMVRNLSIMLFLIVGTFLTLFYATNNFDAEIPKSTYGLSVFAFFAISLAIYANIRVFSYQGIVVCGGSLAPRQTFRVTRGWNLIRIGVILVGVWGITGIVEWVVTTYVFQWLFWALTTLFQATSTYTKIVGQGDVAGWVYPLFAWIWALLKIAYTVFWTFFTYGVTAGLLGRLYRESERTEFS